MLRAKERGGNQKLLTKNYFIRRKEQETSRYVSTGGKEKDSANGETPPALAALTQQSKSKYLKDVGKKALAHGNRREAPSLGPIKHKGLDGHGGTAFSALHACREGQVRPQMEEPYKHKKPVKGKGGDMHDPCELKTHSSEVLASTGKHHSS